VTSTRTTSRAVLVLCLSSAVVALPQVALAAQPPGSGHSSNTGAPGPAHAAHAGHAAQAAQAAQGTGHGAHDPAGDNGTIKIQSTTPPGGDANAPQQPCSFSLELFGFDQNQHADITFTGQAPTPTGTLHTQHDVLVSTTPAGGGQDVDAVLTYTADQLGLTAVPQANHGWHVKVDVDVLEAPGGSKQKVFWLSCPPAATEGGSAGGGGTTGTTGSTAGGGSGDTTGSTAGTETTGTQTTGTQTTGTTTAGGAAGGGDLTLGGGTVSAPATAESGGAQDAFTGGGGTLSAVRAQSFAAGGGPLRAAGLPFTGFELADGLTMGLTALGAGVLALVAGRRRRVTG
jgi:hypothetical protein